MYNKKKIATLLAIGMAAMCMMNGCQKKTSETEAPKETTAQTSTSAQTEAAVKNYTSESNSFSFDLPDSAWTATKEGIENKWAFMKEGVGTIQITHKKSKIKAKNLPQSQEEAIALLNKIKENAFSQVEYKKDSSNGTELYYYAASTQDSELGYVYLIKYLINTETESYTITAKLTSSDSSEQQAVKSAVTSFKVLNDDSKKTASDSTGSDASTNGSSSADNSGSSSNTQDTEINAEVDNSSDGSDTSSETTTDEEYRYFFDANGNTIYAYPSDDGSWRDENGNSYIFLENGVEDSNGTQYYYDPPQGTTGSDSSNSSGAGSSSGDGMVIGFYDVNGNYQTATQDANGNWIGSDGKTYTFDENGATDSDGNFSKW